MNRFILKAVLLAAMSCSIAIKAEEPIDTVRVIDRATDVTVTRTGATTVVEAQTETGNVSSAYRYEITVDNNVGNDPAYEDDAWTINLPFVELTSRGERITKQPKKSRRTMERSIIACSHVYIGQRFNYFDKSGIKNSYEIGIRNFFAVKWTRGGCSPSFSIGVGYSRQHYNTQRGVGFAKAGDRLDILPYGEGVRLDKSSLDIFSFQVPFMVTQPLGENQKLMIGAVARLNTFAKGSVKYTDGDISHTIHFKGLQQRLFTPELIGALGLCEGIGIYASWSPVPAFSKEYGPELKSWSLGATLVF